MTWTLPSSKAGLAVLISLVMVVSASVGFVTLGLLDNGNEPSPDENATDTGETAPDDALQAECANTSATASLRQGAPGQRAQLNNTSSAAAPSTSGTAPMQVRRENATQAAKRGDGTMRTNIKCAIANLSSPPAWVSNLTNATGTSEQATATAGETRATNTTRAVESQRAFARDLRAILSNESRSRRAATLDAAERALGERQQLAADGQLNASLQPLLTAERTNLRGARRLLQTETQTKTEGPPLRRAARLATQGMKLQTARLNQDSGSADPTAVSLPETPMPDHDRPSAAAFAILEKQNVQPTDDQAADIRALDDLPESTRTELTDYLDAYLGYYLTTQQAYAGANRTRLDNTSAPGSTASPSAADLQRVRAAHQRLLDATVALQTALDDSTTSGSGAGSSQAAVNESLQVAPVLSIDLSSRSNTYETEYALQIDRGGDDTYNNNAGGNTGNFSAAALADFGGSDTYRGRNGGGVWDGAGFLVDAGPGTDTYNATDNPEKLPTSHPCIPAAGGDAEPGSYGTNGGGALGGVGFLLDAGNDKTIYKAGDHGTNGGARGEFCTGWGGSETSRKLAMGFLVDAGTDNDIYTAGDTGTNGGGSEGYGFLLDTGGNDTYDAGKSATNGGGIGAGFESMQGPIGRTIKGIVGNPNPSRSEPPVPAPGGFLLDARGTDTYAAGANSNDVTFGTNGGGASGGTGFLVDAGTGADTYDAGNGTGKWGTNGGGFGGVGFLLDEAGTETYDAGDTGTNGGSVGGAGFLVDGAGTDTYDAGDKGTNGGAVKTHMLLATVNPNNGLRSSFSDDASMGFLLDAGSSNDTYTAGHKGTNGGANGGSEPVEREDTSNAVTVEVNKVPAGFLLDTGGDDSYVAGIQDTNGGASNGIGVLYDNAGADYYNDAKVTCHDCSLIPKGSVGAQVDRGGDGESGERSGSGEVLVVDDTASAADADCPDASYQAIQPAVDNASSGDTVRVCAGTYPGKITVNTPSVALRAAESGQVVLDGGWTRKYGVVLQARGTTVTGFTATNFTATGAAAFVSTLPSTTIANNSVRNSYYGILHTPPGFSDPPETAIRNNSITGTPIGIRIANAEDVTIRDNIVIGDTVPGTTKQHGISSLRSTKVRITNNTVTGFTAAANRTYNQNVAPFGYGYGIEVLNGNPEAEAEHTLRNNTLANNTYNLQLYSTDHADYSDYVIDASNTVDGKPVLYLKGVQNSVIDPAVDPGYVACIDCVNVTVRDMELAHNGQGVLIANSRNAHVTNVTVHDTWRGISLRASPRQSSVTNNMIKESYNAIAIRHDCDSLLRCVPAGPSVLVANNTVRETGFLFTTRFAGQTYIGVDAWHGGAVLVTGDGVRVRRNTIADAFGAGISIKNGHPYGGNAGLLGTGRSVEQASNATAAVANNTISDAYLGIMSIGSQGTTFTANEITNTRIGLFNIGNRDLTYRDNIVTNATFGMFVHFRDVNITARNNAFREVTWGLDVLFTWYATPPDAPASHNFGTSNTVNGERLLWLKDAKNRVIDDDNGSQVVCIRCINVTIRDMALTDNAHGVVLWDSTNSRIENVTVTDTLQQGVTIIEGDHNVVRDTTVIDSSEGIRVQPMNRDNDADALETVGAVRLINNHVTVKDATYPDQPYAHSGLLGLGWTTPLTWNHWGITLFNPTTATVAGNRVTNTTWGINQEVSVLAERNPQEYQYPKAADNINILNNTVSHPAQPMGLARAEERTREVRVFHASETIGIRINTEQVKLPDASIEIDNNTLTDHGSGPSGSDQKFGIRIDTDELPSIGVSGNRLKGFDKSVRIAGTADDDTLGVSLRRNRLTGASTASVFLSGSTPGDAVAIHGNLLEPQAAAGSAGYGVMYANATRTVNATCNKWGAPSGPSSPSGTTLADPETGVSADGAGSAVSESDTEGEANVHFHPWLGESPQLVCNLRAQIPAEKPTQTPRPTVDGGDGSGSGDGDGPGSGDGDGPGSGDGDGGGRNEDSDQNRPTASEGTPQAKGTPSETPSESPTDPPLATPEIVPGFGVGVGLVALVILVGVLAVRRRE